MTWSSLFSYQLWFFNSPGSEQMTGKVKILKFFFSQLSGIASCNKYELKVLALSLLSIEYIKISKGQEK